MVTLSAFILHSDSVNMLDLFPFALCSLPPFSKMPPSRVWFPPLENKAMSLTVQQPISSIAPILKSQMLLL